MSVTFDLGAVGSSVIDDDGGDCVRCLRGNGFWVELNSTSRVTLITLPVTLLHAVTRDASLHTFRCCAADVLYI